MRKLLLFGAVAAIGAGFAGQSHAAVVGPSSAPVIAAPIPDTEMGMPIVQAYWERGPHGRYWVEEHHRRWRDRWGHWHRD